MAPIMFQHDNAPEHKPMVRSNEETAFKAAVEELKWPVQKPDLNPSEQPPGLLTATSLMLLWPNEYKSSQP